MLKRMGVMNVTPNSFSDGGELSSSNFQQKLQQMGPIDALDIGAESTAPMNGPISCNEEWERLVPFLPFLKDLRSTISLDTYHPETIFRVAKNWKGPLIWNDVSGKFDSHVADFLRMNENFHYIFCHNLAPSRELTIRHMQCLSERQDEDFVRELAEYFLPHIHPQVILDPCLGFSKSYTQNWYVLDNFHKLQSLVPHNRWLIGFSRKSFLRNKYGLGLDSREELDRKHVEEVHRLLPLLKGEVWFRTHQPEIL